MPSSFIKDTRGAAMVEGVIVFPLFIIVFAAVLYYHQAYSVKLERNNEARSCAWTYSVSGCDKVPDGCPIRDIGEAAFSGIDEGLEGRKAVFPQGGTPGITDERSDLGKALGSGNKLLLALTGLEQGIVARPSREVKMPSLLGGATRNITGNYSVMCNEISRSPMDLLVDSYCGISNSLPGCP